MEFFDQATIFVRAGRGGNGAATFRREKFIPHGGPDGGDGGAGGNVYLVASAELHSLAVFNDRTRFFAQDGGHGGRRKQHGKKGKDLAIAVPAGTVVSTEIDGQTYQIDLERPGQKLLAARGGRGGLGNVHFATPSHQAPRIAELGEPGEERWLRLELKMIADVGLVGFPNAGKSTLLSVISAARPKIAPYPFTTLQPNLGVVDVGYYRFLVTDIPGLVAGAHKGIGLGHGFLRHVERTRMLLHVIDAAGVDGRDPLEDYHQITEELSRYHAELSTRPQLVVLNKMDLPSARERLPELLERLPVPRSSIFPIAAATREGITPLLNATVALLMTLPAPNREPVDPDTPPFTWPVPETDPNDFTIEREGSGWRVRGKKIERLVTMTNFDQPESLDRVQRVLAASGISAALIAAGIQENDVVNIANVQLVWSEVDYYG